MKILVLSLLRVGDLIMQEPLLRALQKKYPEASIHLLLNDSSSSYAKQCLPEFQAYFIPRSRLQDFLVSTDRPTLRAYEVLSDILQKLNQQEFDMAFNFTHNRFSARILDVLQIQKIYGAHYKNGKAIADLVLMNEFSDDKKPTKQYAETLAAGFGLTLSPAPQARLGRVKNILINPLTSDKKKNWPLQKYLALAWELRSLNPDLNIEFVCAPGESKQIDQKEFPIKELSWGQLRDGFRKADLLISGDTAALHLAAAQGIATVGLYLGGANIHKTAPRQIGAILLNPSSSCYPCKHSEPCHQSQHVCAQDLKVDDVLTAILKKLNSHKEAQDVPRFGDTSFECASTP